MDAKKIGRRIKAAREAKKLTQEQLAELVNLSPMHMSVLERGHKPPKLETLVTIANALDVSADNLLQDVVNRSGETTPSEIAELIATLPRAEQVRILCGLKAYCTAELLSLIHI